MTTPTNSSQLADKLAGKLAGKLAVITGGSRGIGHGIALRFAQEGASLMLAASSPERLQQAAQTLKAHSQAEIGWHAADLRTTTGCKALAEETLKHFGRCDILVNSAGASQPGRFVEQSDDVWQDGFALKFYSAVRLCRLLWPELTKAQGHVVNIIGGFARTPDPDFLIGGSVNAALANFSKGLAGLGKHHGVLVNAIHPGLTETERVWDIFRTKAKMANTTPEAVRDQAMTREGLRRLGSTEDVAALALFLCSDQARHIQGVAVAVDGGATAGLY